MGAINAIRKPPVEAILAQYPQGKRGLCGWCGNEVSEKTHVRGWAKWWHGACLLEMQIITQPDVARRCVEERDHGICADCGAPPQCEPRTVIRGRGTQWQHEEVVSVVLWHVDHNIPLWKVAHMPPLQRIEYFKLWNLVTRCEKCHKAKSKREEAEQAHFDRLAEPKDSKPGRKLLSRPFQKGHRPMRRK